MYTFETMITVTVCLLLWNVTLLVKIRFGNKLVTHLSVLPYLVSLVLQVVILMEQIGLAYLANIYYYDYYLYELLFALFSPETVVC